MIYTIGYVHWTAAGLHRHLSSMNALLVDIRYNPQSMRPDFTQQALQERFGEDYHWLPALGNVAYRTGGIELADWRAGRQFIRDFTRAWMRPLCLMCACIDYQTCHRRVVADRLRAEGYPVEELEPPADAGFIKALTLHQPWASLVALGVKTLETRSWWTAYRGPLAIHAAKAFGVSNQALCHQEPFKVALLAGGFEQVSDLPLGAVVALADLKSCKEMTKEWLAYTNLSDQERAFGHYALGRYAWHLVNVQPVNPPIPARGAQGLWTWTEERKD
jgi:hypothetical protein